MVLRPSTLVEDIHELFSDPADREHADGFLSTIRENWRQNNAALGRSITWILLLAAVFELLIRAAIEKVSVGPFEIKDLSLVRVAIPPIIAYLYYEVGILSARQYLFRDVHDAVIRVVNGKAYDAGLNLLLSPEEHPLTYPNLWGYERIRLLRLVNGTLPLATFGGIVIFEGYAYFVQLFRLNVRGPIIWISLAISVFLIGSTLALVVGGRGSAEQRGVR